jgi:hypothetical protein
MHTNVCTVRDRTRDLLRNRRILGLLPLRQIGRINIFIRKPLEILENTFLSLKGIL